MLNFRSKVQKLAVGSKVFGAAAMKALDGKKKLCTTSVQTRVFTAGFFFRPTPSWLSPGRYTRSTAAKR
jgi:hypothetical protein